MKEIKCYTFTSPDFGMGGKKVEENLRKYAPDNVVFVDTIEESDINILHCQQRTSFEFFYKPEKPTILLFSEYDIFDGALKWTDNGYPILPPAVFKYYNDIFKECKMVYSFQPLKKLGFEGNCIEGPWGVDTDKFIRNNGVLKNDTVICFGHWIDGERYDDLYKAVVRVRGKLVHVGYHMGVAQEMGKAYNPKFGRTYGKISDEALLKLFNTTKFVSGLRTGMGFEIQVLEGLLCGCRPICFDSPYYTRWFSKIAEFVPQDLDKLTDNLADIFANPRPVTQEEIEYVRSEYNWRDIANQFWRRVLASV